MGRFSGVSISVVNSGGGDRFSRSWLFRLRQWVTCEKIYVVRFR